MPHHPKRGKRKVNRLDVSPPSKTYNLSLDIATRILGYVKIDKHYSRDMHNFALVETSWRKPATCLLYTHVNFESYDNMLKYILKISQNPNYASTASTLRISGFSGVSNTEADLCRLIESCPNIISFKVFKCPPTWITDPVLLTMSACWPHLTELSLHCRNRCHGKTFITAMKSWPGLTHLDLTNISGISAGQYHEIIRRLPNLRFLRLSRLVNEQRFSDLMSDGLLRAVGDTSRFLKIIDFNNCTRFSNPHILNCFKSLADTLECLVITGCKQISGITLAEIIAACNSLRFVNVSNSSFNDMALRHLSGTHAPRISQRIEQFAMSDCSSISLAPFRLFANVLGSHVRDGHVESCIVYIEHMMLKLHKRHIKVIEEVNPGLTIEAGRNGFVLDEIMESIVGPVVGPMVGRSVAPVAGPVAEPMG